MPLPGHPKAYDQAERHGVLDEAQAHHTMWMVCTPVLTHMISRIAVRRGPETMLYSREAGSEDQGLDTAGVGGTEAKRKHAHNKENENDRE